MTVSSRIKSSYRRAEYDFGSCYPQFGLPRWLERSLIDTGEKSEIVNSLNPRDHQLALQNTDALLSQALARFLTIPYFFQDNFIPTSSGAMSINRVLAKLSKNRNRATILVPTLDLYDIFCKEMKIFTSYFQIGAGRIDLDDMFDFLNDQKSDILIIVLPNNPTGYFFSTDEINDILKFCSENDISLMIDGCFLVAGGDYSSYVDWTSLFYSDCDWYFLWDTSKTFGLKHRKCGFIWTNSKNYADLSQCVEELVFEIPLIDKLIFLDIFSKAVDENYLREFNRLIDINRQTFESCIGRHAPLLLPRFGTFLSFDTGSDVPDQWVDDILNIEKVGLTPWYDFFPGHSIVNRSRLVRVCIARDHQFLAAGMERIASFITNAKLNLHHGYVRYG